MDQPTIDAWFEKLGVLLQDRKLPCEFGPARVCDLSEFMLMQVVAGVAQFKHRFTRNYVMVKPAVRDGMGWIDPSGFDLFVPVTRTALKHGFFDKE